MNAVDIIILTAITLLFVLIVFYRVRKRQNFKKENASTFGCGGGSGCGSCGGCEFARKK